MMPGDSQFPNPNPPRPPGPIRPPVGTINPVKPTPKTPDRTKNNSKPPTTDGKTTAPMLINPGYKPKQTILPYMKKDSGKLGRGF